MLDGFSQVSGDPWRLLIFEEWDTKRLFGRLVGWAAMLIVGDLEVGTEKKARVSVSFHLTPLVFSLVLVVVSLSSFIPPLLLEPLFQPLEKINLLSTAGVRR